MYTWILSSLWWHLSSLLLYPPLPIVSMLSWCKMLYHCTVFNSCKSLDMQFSYVQILQNEGNLHEIQIMLVFKPYLVSRRRHLFLCPSWRANVVYGECKMFLLISFWLMIFHIYIASILNSFIIENAKDSVKVVSWWNKTGLSTHMQ